MKITIYELLGMVKDGKLEDETKFKYNNDYFKYWKKSNSFDRYEDKTYTTVQYYNDDLYDLTMLNEEVEILEEEKKIPEKLDIKDIYSCDDYQQIHINFKSTWNKINEIIDYLKSKGE